MACTVGEGCGMYSRREGGMYSRRGVWHVQLEKGVACTVGEGCGMYSRRGVWHVQ